MSPGIGTGATIFGCAGPVLLPEERAFFREADPFGFILFARNVETPDQLRRLTQDLREAVGREAPILVDQEGGRVQRLRAPHWREWEPPFDTVARFARIEDATRAMNLRAQIIASELRAVGIDANCAPVADVARDATHPFLKNRCYGSDPPRSRPSRGRWPTAFWPAACCPWSSTCPATACRGWTPTTTCRPSPKAARPLPRPTSPRSAPWPTCRWR
jgi:hypothetical protein